MWIITHDNVHEAGINPALNVPKSHDYMTQATRKKAACRKRNFRLMRQGRELFRGVAYFENDASFKEILRPLDEFGRSMYDCDGIEYQVLNLQHIPNGYAVWNRIREDDVRRIDNLIADGRIKSLSAILEECGADSSCELSDPDGREILKAFE